MNARVWAVTRWEFLRFAKARDLVVGALIFAVMFGAGGSFGEFVAGIGDRERTVRVVGRLAALPAEGVTLSGVHFEPGSATDVDSLLAVEAIDAALLESDDGAWELRVRRERSWTDLVGARFAGLLVQERAGELGLDAADLRSLTQPPEVRTVTVGDAPRGDGRTSVFTAGIALGVMFMALFIGFSFVFVAITAEKTQRTTESMLSALTPQEWIDGKILGLTGAVFVNLLSTVAGYLLWQLVAVLFLDRSPALPGGAHPADVFGLALFALGGFAFWFTLFALVAATIDDPNSSSRSSLMFLPFLLMGAAFAGLDSPDAPWMRALSIVPGTSPAAMPVRLLRGDPHLFEVVASLVLLAAGAWFFRWAAGRVFGTSMLMTGKEPSLREVMRWLREA